MKKKMTVEIKMEVADYSVANRMIEFISKTAATYSKTYISSVNVTENNVKKSEEKKEILQ